MSAATHSEVAPENQHDGTIASDHDLKAGRRKVARSRGVFSGILLILLGAWAALAPFIGPYFDFGFDPRSGDAWHWTSGRGLYEVLPGGVAVLAGIVLLVSASRALTVLLAWLAALAGVWLVIAPTLSAVLTVAIGSPPADANTNKSVALALAYFFATGVAITLVAGIALGRLSVHSVRDVRAAEHRAELAAAEEARRQEAERVELQRRESERLENERRENERRENERRENERRENERRENERRENERRENERLEDERRGNARRENDGQHDGLDPDRRTAALPVVDGHRDHDAQNAPTAAHPVATEDRYAAPAATPYETAGPRDAAGSSSYSGHRASGQPEEQPAAPPTQSGAHAVDPDAPVQPQHNPSTPPPPGGTEQYRYGTTEYPVPPEERGR